MGVVIAIQLLTTGVRPLTGTLDIFLKMDGEETTNEKPMGIMNVI